MEQMSSKGLGTIGSSIDSANTRQGPGPPQDVDLAGESSTDSAGCSGMEASQTVYSTDVSEGVARKGRARYGYKRLKPYRESGARQYRAQLSRAALDRTLDR